MNWQDIEGWFSPQDAEFIQSICKTVHDGVVVELGFFAGRGTAVLAPICKANNNVFHAVDNCAGACPRDPATKAQQSRDMLKVFENNMSKLGLLDCMCVHVLDSTKSAGIFLDGSVDFCFIDASHVEEDVKRDIKSWWPKIKPGGVLGGHDWTWGSIKNAVGDFVKTCGLQPVTLGNCWKVIKRENA